MQEVLRICSLLKIGEGEEKGLDVANAEYVKVTPQTSGSNQASFPRLGTCLNIGLIRTVAAH